MSNHKRWVQRGGGEFFKWDTPGKELEGLWRGTKEGKFGTLGTIEYGQSSVTFPLHTALALLCDGLKDGQEIKIVYHGKVTNPKSGREYKSFDLFVATQEGQEGGADDDDIPF